MKKAVLVGISYATNDNLKQYDFGEQPGAPKDVVRLRKLLTSMSQFPSRRKPVIGP